MTKIQLARLEKLGRHILKGKLAHKVFDFSTVNSPYDNNFRCDNRRCCTNGCAFGEMPQLWPRKFAWDIFHVVDLRTRIRYTIEGAAWEWFGLNAVEAYMLFVPLGGSSSEREHKSLARQSGCKVLPAYAGRIAVGNNILKMVKWKRSLRKKKAHAQKLNT